MIKLEPLGSRVLVLPISANEKVGGVIIPDTAKKDFRRGKVISVGKGIKDDPMVVKIGDNLLYKKDAGTEITINKVNILLLRQSDCLIILDSES